MDDRTYYFCFAVLMKSLAQWSAHLPPGRIDFVFDRKDGFQGFTDEMFNTLKRVNVTHADRLGEINFRSSHIFRPLQAADLLVYEVRRFASDILAGSKRPVRGSMQALMKDSGLIVGRADANYLHAHVEARKRQLGIA